MDIPFMKNKLLNIDFKEEKEKEQEQTQADELKIDP